MTQAAGGEFSAVRPARLPQEPRTKGTAMSETARAEVEGVEMAPVSWRGIEFEVPRFRVDWPFDAVVAAEEEKWPLMLRSLLPDEALMQFRALRPTQRDAFDLLNEISTALGFADKGESPASAE